MKCSINGNGSRSELQSVDNIDVLDEHTGRFVSASMAPGMTTAEIQHWPERGAAAYSS